MNQAELIELAEKVGWRITPYSVATALASADGTVFHAGRHLKLISDAIVDAVHGFGPRNVAVSMPPQHGKSQMISRRAAEWFLANWPEKTVAVGGYGNDFAQSWGRLVRNDIVRHSDLFGFQVAEDSKAVNWWHTDQEGGMWTAGFGGQATGKPAQFLIIDDPIKNQAEAFSLVARDSVWEEWQKTFLSRLHENCAAVVVMTRWHSDDLIGRLLSGYEGTDASSWREIRLPAIWDGDAPDEIGRVKGEALFPELFSIKALRTKKRGMSPDTWASLYQQQPSNETGIGRIYHDFDKNLNVKELERGQNKRLFWSLDFNVDPMSSVIGQVNEYATPMAHLTNEIVTEIEILEEISLPNSNTPEACHEFHARVSQLCQGRRPVIDLYGDASGNARSRAGANLSDWEIVKRFLRDNGYSFNDHIITSDPPVRDRVNAMNAAFKSADGLRSMFVNSKCKGLIKDFENVRWKRDAAGNPSNQIDKSDKNLTHLSDALGYMVHTRFAIRASAGEQAGHAR